MGLDFEFLVVAVAVAVVVVVVAVGSSEFIVDFISRNVVTAELT